MGSINRRSKELRPVLQTTTRRAIPALTDASHAIDSSVRANNDRDVVIGKILLKRKIAVDGHKHFEFPFGQDEEVAIFDARPAHLKNRFDVMSKNFSHEPTIDTFIE